MIDALNLGGPANLELIHLEEPRERAYWAHVLDVSEDELKRAVARVGSQAVDVRQHIARMRRAERQHSMRRTPPHEHIEHDTREPNGDTGLVLLISCAAAMATAFGALIYSAMPSDEWTTLQRQYGCQAVVNSNPAIKQLRCADGRTVMRTRLAEAVDDSTTKPVH